MTDLDASQLPSLGYPSELPIVAERETIVDAIREYPVLVITGDTGSGKSTQIPKMCLEAGLGGGGLIGVTQPRRIAAVTLAQRVAEEMGAAGPRLVGYKIRFQDRTSRSTRIKYMTDGILLAEAQRDRNFRAYEAIVIDEAHERTLNIDFLLGLIKRVLKRRPELKLIVSSATIDPERFSEAFNGAPIIRVSGRTYPVEVRYRPPAPEEDEDETTYVDRAVAAVNELKRSRERGDVLMFMPTEGDIRETVQRLEKRNFFNTRVLPLFGRMAAADQRRVFETGLEDKIVVATNVAETSVTIPRIRFVVDTGVARISRYNARTRTQTLPIVPISQASADQRKGRCGRVQAGICIRLFSEEDYLTRDPYTPSEIQRSNLAEVILRMLFLRLGDVRSFPFLDPPAPAAVKDGFAVLRELGAIDDGNKLTKLGKRMARLPLEPRLARMLLEANRAGALRELTVLAAALSIPDPRERPLDLEAQADQAHARFRDRQSDFVTLLRIWDTFAEERGKRGSWNQMRKFCKENFLSFRRMREWLDVHEEIGDILKEMGDFRSNPEPADYNALHRAITSGYLSNIGVRKERNLYQGTKGRQFMVFPGSGLFNKAGEWVVAAEVVQTSRLFARTVANVDVRWLEELGRHLSRSSYSDPHWEKSRGQVVAFERVTLYGLTIVDRRKVNYSRVSPEEAREIFIRAALVRAEISGRYDFIERNQELIKRIEELENKTRRRNLLVDEDTLYEFYHQRLPEGVADQRSFNKLLKDRRGDRWLRLTEADLLREEPDYDELQHYPDELAAGDLRLPLGYAFEPGTERDGITVTVPVHALPRLEQEPFEWLVPGLLPEKVAWLLRALPKTLRRPLVPVGDTAERVSRRLPYRDGDFYLQLSRTVEDVAGVRIPTDAWDREGLPEHLQPRFEVIGPDGEKLGEGRRLPDLREGTTAGYEDRIWTRARQKWEREGIVQWDFGDLPESIDLGRDAFGVQRTAYPALVAEGGAAAVRLYTDPEEAARESLAGLMLLYRFAFESELKAWSRQWSFPGDRVPTIFFMNVRKEEADRLLHDYLLREIFDLHDPVRPARERFERTRRELCGQLGPVGNERLEEVLDVVRERFETYGTIRRYREMAEGNAAARQRQAVILKDLNELVPGDFLERYRSPVMRELPRYLRAMRTRAERAYASPEKDRSKAEGLTLHQNRLREAERELEAEWSAGKAAFIDEYRWMLEELKINSFAPEIKTRYPVSSKRMDKKWQEWFRRSGK